MGKIFDENEKNAEERLPIIEGLLKSILAIVSRLDAANRTDLTASQEVCLLFLGRMKRHTLDCIELKESRSIELLQRSALNGQMLFEWIAGKVEGREDRARRYLNLRVVEFAKFRSHKMFQDREVPSEWDSIVHEELGKLSEDELNAEDFNDIMTKQYSGKGSKSFFHLLMEEQTVYGIFNAANSIPVYETSYLFLSTFEHWNPVSMPQMEASGALESLFNTAAYTQATVLWDFARMLYSVGQVAAFEFGDRHTWQLLHNTWSQFEAQTKDWGEWP